MSLFRSPAKVNLHLEVRGRRSDGYHELFTIFQTVGLWDDLEVELTRGGVELEVEGDAPGGPENLAWRAARAYLDRFAPGRGARILLRKRIPAGGGLGGGSGNAATVLLALHELLGYPATDAALDLLARELGSDVPFFLVGGTAAGTGRGDEIRALRDLPSRTLVLLLPPLSCPTTEVFRALDDLTGTAPDPRMTALVQADAVTWSALASARNDLETVAWRRWPLLERLRDELLETGASTARLSGTGSTVFGWSEGAAGVDERGLERRLGASCRIERVPTVPRGAVRAQGDQDDI